MSDAEPWHRYLGLALASFFRGTGVRVESEVDLSLKRQLLDVVVIRPRRAAVTRPLPDGLGPLARHTLVTFKSHQDTLDAWAMDEFTGHYVNYRKAKRRKDGVLPPPGWFRTVAVTARHPRALAGRTRLRPVTPGVYRARSFGRPVTVVVAGELPQEPHNAPLHLFAADPVLVEYGAAHFGPVSDEVSTLLSQLITRYGGEGVAMPETLKEFVKRVRRETAAEMLPELPPEQRLAGLAPEERLAGLTPEQRLAGLTPEQLAELARLAQRAASPPAGPADPAGG